MQPAMSIKYVVEEADLEQRRADFVSLWAAHLSGGRRTADDAAAKLDAGYLHNPAGPGHGFLMSTQGGTAVAGVIGLHPRRFRAGAERIRAANLADYAVDPAHRTLGPALLLMKHGLTAARKHFDLVYALPNRSSQAVCLRAGLKRLGQLQRHARPLSTRRHLRSRLGALAAVLAPLADGAIRLVDAARALRLRGGLHWNDTDFDAPALQRVWDQQAAAFLMSERSPAMLRWRYASASRGAWRLSVALGAEGEPVGYVVWRLHRGAADVGDFLSVDAERWTAPLMDGFARHVRRHGADAVSLMFFGAPAVEAGLRAAGYHLREGGMPLFIATPCVEGSEEARRWYLTAFDDDAD
jgi:hypothetical protein